MKSHRLIGLLTLLSLALPAGASDGSLPDFSSLSLQELATVKVTSVSKRQQKLTQVAAAVYVITREEIHRSGMTNIPDLLRLVPGLSVSRIDGSKWGVTSRGFNGRFANKLLVLVDGRSIYNPIFSGVYWDMNMPRLDHIERIEVIRGPGASVWGANAVSGVINIITRSSIDTTGVEVIASAGSSERASGEIQAGGKFANGPSYRTYLEAADHAALQTVDGRNARDGRSDVQAGFRIDGTSRRGDWQFEGDMFHNTRGEASYLPTPQNNFSDATHYGTETGISGNLAFEWRRRISDTSDLRVNASYDYVDRPEIGFSSEKASTGGLEIQYHFTAGKHHEISLGAGDRLVFDSVEGQGLISFQPSSLTYQTASAFAQDEIHLFADRLLLTSGVKVEHDLLGGWQTQPTVRALWAPNRRHSAWVSASRAVRTPTFYERTAQLEFAALPSSAQTFGLPVVMSVNGSKSFRAEVSKDYELGYRAQLSPGLSLDLTGFYTHYDDLRTGTPGNLSLVYQTQPYLLLPYYLNNFGRGHAEGGEAAIAYHPFARWKTAASYSFLNVHQILTSAAPAGTITVTSNASPVHQAKLQSYWNLSRSLQLDALLFCSTPFLSPVYPSGQVVIPNQARVDLRLGWRAASHWELSLVGQDLGSSGHLELTPEALSPASYNGRGVYLKSIWRF